jgi:hypothetical protein
MPLGARRSNDHIWLPASRHRTGLSLVVDALAQLLAQMLEWPCACPFQNGYGSRFVGTLELETVRT